MSQLRSIKNNIIELTECDVLISGVAYKYVVKPTGKKTFNWFKNGLRIPNKLWISKYGVYIVSNTPESKAFLEKKGMLIDGSCHDS